jgi:hypothetical protein
LIEDPTNGVSAQIKTEKKKSYFLKKENPGG